MLAALRPHPTRNMCMEYIYLLCKKEEKKEFIFCPSLSLS